MRKKIKGKCSFIQKNGDKENIKSWSVNMAGKMLYPSKFWNQALGDVPLSTEDTLQEDFLMKQVARSWKRLCQEMSPFQWKGT